MTNENHVLQSFQLATERYASLGVDTTQVLEKMNKISLSLHCWQADDVTGFENQGGSLTGGIQVTGNYPGKARTIDELRLDVLCAKSYIPGTHRLNLHEIYGDFEGKVVDRNEVEPCHFQSWMEWGKEKQAAITPATPVAAVAALSACRSSRNRPRRASRCRTPRRAGSAPARRGR